MTINSFDYYSDYLRRILPKMKIAAFMVLRDQWAKYILLYHRNSYNIYLDEGNLIKAINNTFGSNHQNRKVCEILVL